MLQYPVAIFGILRAACTVVNVNPLYTPRELEHQLKDSGVEAIVILENFATPLEQVVAKMPQVMECVAVGVPDAHSSEAVKLFVVKKDASLTEEQVKAFCKESLTGYKCPKHVEFRAELPKTNVGKILRRTLRDEELTKMNKAASAAVAEKTAKNRLHQRFQQF